MITWIRITKKDRRKCARGKSNIKDNYLCNPSNPLICDYFWVMKDFDSSLYRLVDHALQEDVGDGDHSTLSCIPADVKGKAVLKIKQDGILAGVDVAEKIFRYKKPNSKFIRNKNDGEEMKAGEVAFEVETSVHTILQLERLVLNCMQRMSG